MFSEHAVDLGCEAAARATAGRITACSATA